MTAVALPPSSSGPTLSAAGLGAVRCALQAQLRQSLPEQSLRQALRLLCDDARRHGIQPEQLIVLLKQAWLTLPEIHSLPAGALRREPLARVVTLCIQEFYAARN